MRPRNETFFLWINRMFWPLFYLRHQGRQTMTMEVGDGTKLQARVNTSDIFVIWEIWRTKVYDDKNLPIGEGDIVVDIGAHIGAFAVRAAKQAHNGRVYAYEASSLNHTLLARNRQINSLENLHIENRAVAGKAGRLTLFRPADNGALGSLLHESGRFIEVVQATTLTDLIAEHGIEQIDLLKMDVEGAEYDILLNCPVDTLKKVRRLVMEFHDFRDDPRSHRDLVDFLNSHGFTAVAEKNASSLMDWFGAWFGGMIIRTGTIKAWRD